MATFNGRLHCAPLDKPPKRVLDAGTGTGVWAIEFADEYPDAVVSGVDLSPIQPGFVPPNVQFFIDDLEDDWAFGAKFDFIFSRFMTGSIQDFPKFLKQSYEYATPLLAFVHSLR
jgi:trans-aconitate methyltransferase